MHMDFFLAKFKHRKCNKHQSGFLLVFVICCLATQNAFLSPLTLETFGHDFYTRYLSIVLCVCHYLHLNSTVQNSVCCAAFDTFLLGVRKIIVSTMRGVSVYIWQHIRLKKEVVGAVTLIASWKGFRIQHKIR